MTRLAHIILILFAVTTTGGLSQAAQQRLYLANPLGFSEAGRDFKEKVLKPALSKIGFDVIDPWELTDAKKIEPIKTLPYGQERKVAWERLNPEIATQNREAIDRADIVFAVLDGTDVDSGTAAEIGYAFAKGKRIYGYRGDFRLAADNESSIVNLQVEYFIRATGGKIFTDVAQLDDMTRPAAPIAQAAPATAVQPPAAAQPSAAARPVQPAPASITQQIKAASRSILDVFTIFPFAIVLSLALGEAFKMVVHDEKTPGFIEWDKLFTLASFLLLMLPFYQGMNKYLLITYGELAEGPRPASGFLIVDGTAFMIESALFFAMSRTLSLQNWKRFYRVVFWLLLVDSTWDGRFALTPMRRLPISFRIGRR